MGGCNNGRNKKTKCLVYMWVHVKLCNREGMGIKHFAKKNKFWVYLVFVMKIKSKYFGNSVFLARKCIIQILDRKYISGIFVMKINSRYFGQESKLYVFWA